jgi:hypothetical protein
MREVAEYRRYAELCRKMGRDMSDPESKRQLMEMATVWTLLASERERLLQNDRSIETDRDASPNFAAGR